MEEHEKQRIWKELKALLATYDKRLHGETEPRWKSTAKVTKPSYGLVGKKEVSVLGRPAQATYFAGIIMQKHFVGLYVMPIYSHPQLLRGLSPELKKMVKGKSCINVTRLTPALKKEIADLLKAGYTLYKAEGWL